MSDTDFSFYKQDETETTVVRNREWSTGEVVYSGWGDSTPTRNFTVADESRDDLVYRPLSYITMQVNGRGPEHGERKPIDISMDKQAVNELIDMLSDIRDNME